MSTASNGSRKSILNRHTSLELVTIASPCLIFLVAGTVVLSWPLAVLGWFSCGLLGLLIAVGSGRTSTIGLSLIDWPRPESNGDIVVSALAYNSVLFLGTVIAQVVWEISGNFVLTVGIGLFLPGWFLKHIHFLVFIADE